MTVKINTTSKTIEIESATIEEIVELAKKYKGYNVVSMNNTIYPYYPPVYPSSPTYIVGDGGTGDVDWDHIITTTVNN